MRQKTIDAIMAHAAAEYPRECCGVVWWRRKAALNVIFLAGILPRRRRTILSFARKITHLLRTGVR